MTILSRALPHVAIFLASLLAVCAPSAVHAATARDAILAVDASETGQHLEIRIRLSAAPAAIPSHFATINPPRIVVDLAATENASDTHTQQLNLHALRSYHIVQSEQRSRLVFNLVQAHAYRLDVEGDSIVIRLDAPPPAQDSNRVQRTDPMSAPTAASGQVKNIEFHRGTQGEGRIVVDLSGPGVTLDVRRQGKQLVTEFIDSTLPAALQQRLDVSDFGTPVQTIRTTQAGARVHMLIDAEGAWDYNAYQKDEQLVIEVRAPAEQGKRALQAYRGERLSLQFQNIEVRAVLQVLADFTGLNIITSDSVAGSLTLRLKDVPWDQALDIVLQARGLDMRRNGNVIWIAPHQELLAKERLELEQRAQIAELEPVHAEVFQLNYQKADAFRKVFGISEDSSSGSTNLASERRHSILSARGSAVVDQRTNQLFVTDTPTVLANIRKLLEKVDIAARQVLIEARIVEADDSFSRNLGARLGFAAKAEGVAIGNSYDSVGELAGLTPPTPTAYGARQAVNLPARAAAGANAGNFALSLFNAAASRFLSLELSALEADGKGKIVSSPRVVTADQQAALIEQGEEIPYQQATSSGATSTAFKKANLKLEVTPQITPDGNVILNVDINKDSRGTVTPGGLAINTKHVKTLVQVENGGTVVIGGIYTQTESHAESKVPLLGDIPVLGHLFKSTARIDNKTELLIFLTPKIVLDRHFWR